MQTRLRPSCGSKVRRAAPGLRGGVGRPYLSSYTCMGLVGVGGAAIVVFAAAGGLLGLLGSVAFLFGGWERSGRRPSLCSGSFAVLGFCWAAELGSIAAAWGLEYMDLPSRCLSLEDRSNQQRLHWGPLG